MEQEMKWAINHLPPSEDSKLPIMSVPEVQKARAFHKSFPQYTETPLTKLPCMADYLGLGSVYIKDESYRFGLNAFKVLGGSYSMARYIAKETGRDVSALPYDILISEALRRDFGQATFFTATDGNHGRGVAWAAQKLGQKAIVHMPKGTTQTRLENIRKLGASVDILDLNYDDCVRQAAKEAAETPHGVMVQDTAWDGYEEIPSWIMQGYGTMAMEAGEQFRQQERSHPTHIFVQAGVGSLAGAVIGYFANLYHDKPPKFIVVEASAADCLYQSAAAGDGKPRIVGGELKTIMAGLACGEPNTISWDILKNHVTAFVSAEDAVTIRGMRMLAAPLKGDPPVVSGESGAVPFGALATIMTSDACRELRDSLGLNANAQVLVFSTEGDTDPDRYQNIVWKGLTK
ncbi:diaminopropionate ammonia-lyase [Megasphaera cerevisiae DSM 20462]|jgi:diaminopropionate ammonia-lyase|uniref:Diaminopropionate ammonia-lyase n=1 Tax=Megasphaera cerevisiae DSM 20462 TaxID=1122219 RepID=A0A0J6WWX5_9FIRM|nr:diaminopropionate ammonia-lyase [Megasphaera cerevisiae]KMO86347.1 diaminopropionate ammonia-lyase [Megasphaera cerevisiae DSM 20462]OKY53426.1 diaminopropionate ammonia-lyase [Megasphaera cerevisiae]SJZ99973.1 diaminopropionate ammonia-lyase [Megasphaera cerevisiae DSM 20462]